MAVDWTKAQQKAARTGRWAVTMAKVRIRRALARTRWQLVTFCGTAGGESVGVVDLMAIRKDHGKPFPGTKRGDNFQIILIQVKGGSAPMPTVEDGNRLRAVARRHRARGVLLAAWTKGKAARFFRLREKQAKALEDWIEVEDLNSVFR
jgi:hypothetical protein